MNTKQPENSSKLLTKTSRNVLTNMERKKSGQRVTYSSSLSLSESCSAAAHYRSVLADSFKLSAM